MSRLRYLTAGESHGEMLVGILEGMPSGLSLVSERDIDPALTARQQGYGRGRRQQIEQDRAKLVSGVRFGTTTGAPIAVLIENKDWSKWKERMAVAPGGKAERAVTVPRPGHADLAGALKYGHEADMRNVLERASARETATRVALGAIALRLLAELGIEASAWVQTIGSVVAAYPSDPFEIRDRLEASAVCMPDAQATDRAIALIDEAKAKGDTLGGTVRCAFRNLPPGLGSHVQWDRKLDADLGRALMSIQAVKAVEVGAGMRAATSFGSEVHDPIELRDGVIRRTHNNAGGIEGGMSNGEPLELTVHMKPISTLMQPLGSVDLGTNEPTLAHIERSDVCAVPALSVIVEAVAALVIADAILTTFGGDTMSELLSRVDERRAKLRRDR